MKLIAMALALVSIGPTSVFAADRVAERCTGTENCPGRNAAAADARIFAQFQRRLGAQIILLRQMRS